MMHRRYLAVLFSPAILILWAIGWISYVNGRKEFTTNKRVTRQPVRNKDYTHLEETTWN
jgi:hypothetical protein